MNRPTLFAAALCAIALPAFAQDATLAPSPTAAAQADATAAGDARVDRLCLRETGTHIRRRAAKSGTRDACASMHSGRVYTQDDLRTTGAVDIADALRRLDPAIR